MCVVLWWLTYVRGPVVRLWFSPPSLLLLCLRTRFISLLDFAFFLFYFGPLLVSSLIMSCGNLQPCLESACFYITHLANFKAEQRSLMTVWTFSVCRFVMAQVTLYQHNRILNYLSYHCLLNMLSCEIEYFNLHELLRAWRTNVKMLNSKVQADLLGCGSGPCVSSKAMFPVS